MKNLESVLTIEQNSTKEKRFTSERLPFGIQYLEKPRVDSPGEVYQWNWKPSVPVYLGNETASWPGTTGTGPTAQEDERYGENG